MRSCDRARDSRLECAAAWCRCNVSGLSFSQAVFQSRLVGRKVSDFETTQPPTNSANADSIEPCRDNSVLSHLLGLWSMEYAANTLVNANHIAEAAALPVGLGMEPLDFDTQTIQLRQPDATRMPAARHRSKRRLRR